MALWVLAESLEGLAWSSSIIDSRLGDPVQSPGPVCSLPQPLLLSILDPWRTTLSPTPTPT